MAEAEEAQRIAAVLSDPTRFSIYQYVVGGGAEAVSAQEVAAAFGLHPNVARMHLNRLREIGLLTARRAKGRHGGRPGLVYAPSGKSLSLNFPPRDYRLLADLLCQAVGALGAEGLRAVEAAGRAYGQQLGEELYASLARGGEPVSVADLLAGAARALSAQGLTARVESAGPAATLRLQNCAFAEVAASHPRLICHLCRGLVQGLLEAHLAVERVRGRRRERGCEYVAEGVAPR